MKKTIPCRRKRQGNKNKPWTHSTPLKTLASCNWGNIVLVPPWRHWSPSLLEKVTSAAPSVETTQRCFFFNWWRPNNTNKRKLSVSKWCSGCRWKNVFTSFLADQIKSKENQYTKLFASEINYQPQSTLNILWTLLGLFRARILFYS